MGYFCWTGSQIYVFRMFLPRSFLIWYDTQSAWGRNRGVECSKHIPKIVTIYHSRRQACSSHHHSDSETSLASPFRADAFVALLCTSRLHFSIKYSKSHEYLSSLPGSTSGVEGSEHSPGWLLDELSDYYSTWLPQEQVALVVYLCLCCAVLFCIFNFHMYLYLYLYLNLNCNCINIYNCIVLLYFCKYNCYIAYKYKWYICAAGNVPSDSSRKQIYNRLKYFKMFLKKSNITYLQIYICIFVQLEMFRQTAA